MTLPQLIIEHALQIAVNPRLRHQPTAHTHTDTAHCTLTRSTNMFATAWPHFKPLQSWTPKCSITTTAHRNEPSTRAFRKLEGKRPRATSLYSQYKL